MTRPPETPGGKGADPPIRSGEYRRSRPPVANVRFERGLAAMRAIDPEQAQRLLMSVSPLAPDLAGYIVEFAFGDIASRPGLDLKLREFAAVAALAALGVTGPQLQVRLHGALSLGWTRDELVELLMQISVHAGFPAAINGLAELKVVLESREAAARP